MYIVYVIGGTSEKMIFEEKNEAYEYAIGISKELEGHTINVYKASLVATVKLPTEPILIKIKKQRIVKKEVFEPAMAKVASKQASKKPVLDPDLQIIAAEQAIAENKAIPLGARCALDNNMAVGQRMGPTGEYVLLCVDCMGQLA